MDSEVNTGKIRRSEGGFTLLELLLALSLLAIILSSLVGWFSLSKRAWEKASATQEASHLIAVRTYLRQKIEGALPVFRRGSAATKPSLVFAGTQTSMMFVGTSRGYTEVGGIYEYHVGDLPSIRSNRSAKALAVSQKLSALPSANTTAETAPSSRVLVNRIQKIRFSYFGGQTRDEVPAWRDAWRSTDRLPQLIKLDINFGHRDERYWPALVVALKLAPTQIQTNHRYR